MLGAYVESIFDVNYMFDYSVLDVIGHNYNMFDCSCDYYLVNN